MPQTSAHRPPRHKPSESHGLLEPDYEVVCVVADGRELVAVAKKHRPDVIVADITMPSLNGIEAAVRMSRPRLSF